MGIESVAARIGRAWHHLRNSNAEIAIKEFEKILQQEPDDIDANYGMGLAQRSAGRQQAAIEYFQRALEIVEQKDSAGRTAREMAANDFQTARIKPNTAEDDRYMMLTRMLKQRLAETNGISKS